MKKSMIIDGDRFRSHLKMLSEATDNPVFETLIRVLPKYELEKKMTDEKTTEKPEIKGYRDLSSEKLEQINTVKKIAISVGDLIDDKLAHDGDVDLRWLAIARTDLQKGFMALVRSIARPTTF